VRSSPKQIWVWLNLEAPISYVYLPEHHKRLRFNWTWSYRLDSDIFAPYRQIFLRDKVPDRMQIIQNYSMVNLRGREVPTELPSLDGFKYAYFASKSTRFLLFMGFYVINYNVRFEFPIAEIENLQPG